MITYRPEYRGALATVAGAQTIALAPLSDSDTDVLLVRLLGADPSVGENWPGIIGRTRRGQPVLRRGDRARTQPARCWKAGRLPNSQRTAGRSAYRRRCRRRSRARIDRLGSPAAKKTPSAASVIGSRSEPDLIEGLGVEVDVEEPAGRAIDRPGLKFTLVRVHAFPPIH